MKTTITLLAILMFYSCSHKNKTDLSTSISDQEINGVTFKKTNLQYNIEVLDPSADDFNLYEISGRNNEKFSLYVGENPDLPTPVGFLTSDSYKMFDSIYINLKNSNYYYLDTIQYDNLKSNTLNYCDFRQYSIYQDEYKRVFFIYPLKVSCNQQVEMIIEFYNTSKKVHVYGSFKGWESLNYLKKIAEDLDFDT